MILDRHITPLQIQYGLTPAESRLALRLITSEPLRSAAAALDISYETAGRTLKKVFKKPGPAARPSSSSSSSALQCFPPPEGMSPMPNGPLGAR
jgi:hypothetical protein